MLRITDYVNTLDMSRVERNQDLYKENEAPESDRADRKGARAAGRLLNVIGTLLICLVIAASLSMILPRFAGYNGYVVVSGSMEPNIPVGSLVYSKAADPALLRTGDVIVFNDPSRGTTPITHRIVSNNPFTQTIITKGDANEREDVNPVSYENVVGKVAVYVPRVGFTASMFTSTLGKIVAILILLEGWLLTEVGRRLKQR